MGQVLIRNLDDALIAAYRESAAAQGRSLEAELREALGKARPSTVSDRDALRAKLVAIQARTGGAPGQPPGWLSIREDRDGDRGS